MNILTSNEIGEKAKIDRYRETVSLETRENICTFLMQKLDISIYLNNYVFMEAKNSFTISILAFSPISFEVRIFIKKSWHECLL